MRGGLFPYTAWWDVPVALNVYWTLLTVFDPLAIAVLLLDLRRGIIFYFAIMVSDVAVNWYAQAVYWSQPLLRSYGLMMQTGFLLFLIASSRRLRRYLRAPATPASGEQPRSPPRPG